MTTRKPNRTLQVTILVAILLAANAFLGYSLAQESERAMTEQIRARMMDLACSAAALLDGDSLETITAIDDNNPAYKEAYDTLAAFQDNVDIAFIYCLRDMGDGRFIFLVDPAEDPGDFNETAAVTDALKLAAEGTPSADLVAYEDRWGRFYTAYCPVLNSKGNVAGIVAVDFAASWYESHAADIDRMIIINSIASLLLALIAIIVIARMSHAERKHEENLARAHSYDALTGLPNMGHFFELADAAYKEMIANDEESAMLYIDLIGMKFFNMKRGFAEGDKLLKAFANLLAEQFGTDRCSRFGQDHFAVSTNTVNLDARLNAFIDECAHINDGKSLPVRIGVYAGLVEAGVEASTACDRAKAACDDAHSVASSSYRYFDANMMAKAEWRQHVINNVDRAISEGWITVHYQPIVRSSTGAVCEEEGFARWIDPERGLIPPSEFIPVLEDARLVYKLDLYVLEQTLHKMHRMEEAGLHVVPASVNISRSDFEACDIVEEVRSRVDASGIERNKVNIEITETAIGRDFDFMKEQIGRFHDLGFQVWMDDFGSEYSSLDYLQSLHFDLLKLDMRFMQQFDNTNDKSKVILTELVKMALGLGIDTIAEGVETREQVEFLRKIGCSKMQGFYFCKPIPLESIIERYATGTAIGFENPAESDYYSALGRVNLYDLSSITRGDDTGFGEYFDTIPMAVLECAEEGFAVLRCNRTYYRFIRKTIGDDRVGVLIPYTQVDPAGDNPFIQAIRECHKNGGRISVEELLPSGSTVHAFVNHIATNPATGTSGMAVAVLAITKA